MKILISGATGFIGKYLVSSFTEAGHQVIALSRNPVKAKQLFGKRAECRFWDGMNSKDWREDVAVSDVIINLAGQSIASWHWTGSIKKQILSSRVEAGRALVEAIAAASEKPKVFIQASAIGYYGLTNRDISGESEPAGEGFLADVAQQWEESSAAVVEMGVRRVVLRIGVVLGKEGGALPKMILPYKMHIGGVQGSGRQAVSWIHIKDLLRAVHFLIDNENLAGVFHLTAPGPVSAENFNRVLSQKLHRADWLHIPGPLLKLFLGKIAKEMLLYGPYVRPSALLKAGFIFNFRDIDSALKDLL